MKKIALFCAVAGMALGVMAGNSDGLKFKFSSSGDTYADGNPVQDGEVYALVWVKSGESFAGFNADGTLVDAANNDLAAVSVAKDSGCVTTVFVVDEKADEGAYYMYLLDTRMDVAGEDGNVVKKVAGLTDGKITVVNKAYEVSQASFELVSDKTVDGAVAPATDAVAVADANLPKPVVAAFDLSDEGATLTVSGTVPYAQYTVYGGNSPTSFEPAPLVTFLNGSIGGTLVLKVDAETVRGYKFFKVATK